MKSSYSYCAHLTSMIMLLWSSNELFYKANNASQFVTHEVIKIGLPESSLIPNSTGLEVLVGILSLEGQHKDILLKYIVVHSTSLVQQADCTRLTQYVLSSLASSWDSTHSPPSRIKQWSMGMRMHAIWCYKLTLRCTVLCINCNNQEFVAHPVLIFSNHGACMYKLPTYNCN